MSVSGKGSGSGGSRFGRESVRYSGSPLSMRIDPERMSIHDVRLEQCVVYRIFAAMRDPSWGTPVPRVRSIGRQAHGSVARADYDDAGYGLETEMKVNIDRISVRVEFRAVGWELPPESLAVDFVRIDVDDDAFGPGEPVERIDAATPVTPQTLFDAADPGITVHLYAIADRAEDPGDDAAEAGASSGCEISRCRVNLRSRLPRFAQFAGTQRRIR